MWHARALSSLRTMPRPTVDDAVFESLRGAVGTSVGHASAPLSRSVELAVAAERGGLDVVTVADSDAESLSLLGAVAASTERVALMSGITQWTRTPVAMSHAAQTVQDLAGGRFWLGVGPMPQAWAEDHHGIAHAPAGSRMRDYVAATRAALAATPEHPTAHEGRFFRTVGYPGRRMTPDRAVPIQLAATRPRMTAIAAEVGDGVMFNAIQPLEWLAGEGAEAIATGLARAGRPRDRFAVGVFRFCAIDEDRAVAYGLARRTIAFYFAIPYFRALLQPLGFADELDAGEAALAAGDAAGQAAAVSDRLVDALGVVGTPDEVRAGLRRVQEHADYVVLGGGVGRTDAEATAQTLRLIETVGPVSRCSRAAGAPAPA